MCTTLAGITLFIYLAAWSAILYYMIHRNMTHGRHIAIPIVLIAIIAVILYIHIHSPCHMNYIKAGAGTEAVLVFILLLNVADYFTRGDPAAAQTAGRDKQEA